MLHARSKSAEVNKLGSNGASLLVMIATIQQLQGSSSQQAWIPTSMLKHTASYIATRGGDSYQKVGGGAKLSLDPLLLL